MIQIRPKTAPLDIGRQRLYVRELTIAELREVDRLPADRRGAFIVNRGLCGEHTEQHFNKDDLDAVEQLPATAVREIVKAVLKLTGVDQGDELPNSVTQSGSTTASASPSAS